MVFIHSTVSPGTCASIDGKQKGEHKAVIINSPVHGKHKDNQMKKDMLRYPKHAGVQEDLSLGARRNIKEHLDSIGFVDVQIVNGWENTEWMKLLSTTYFGLQIAWHQEVERICDDFNLDYNTVTAFFKHGDDINAREFYPGVVGGHCVMPNIEVIRQVRDSELMKWLEWSNEMKKKRG
jgi:UDP-glucose 6-dehydrogenase